MHNRKIAKRYAKAFLHEEMDTEKIDGLTDEMRSFVLALESDEKIKEFFVSPVNSKELKIKIMKTLVEKLGFSTYTFSMIEILIKKDRMDIVSDVYEELQDVSDKIHDRVRVKVTTAYEPSIEDIKELSKRISSYFGRRAIIERQIDREIIGGVILEGEGKVIDMSVMGQIKRALSEI